MLRGFPEQKLLKRSCLGVYILWATGNLLKALQTCQLVIHDFLFMESLNLELGSPAVTASCLVFSFSILVLSCEAFCSRCVLPELAHHDLVTWALTHSCLPQTSVFINPTSEELTLSFRNSVHDHLNCFLLLK